jgi:uncharacterized protein YqeY|tara:strand:+ start:755 stop:982 length:228 start_codon:yes stop_codon:yes gene_type:complete
MSSEIVESVYCILKEYIPAKDREQAARHLVDDLQETLDEQELREVGGIDKHLKDAVEDTLGENELDEVLFEDEEW